MKKKNLHGKLVTTKNIKCVGYVVMHAKRERKSLKFTKVYHRKSVCNYYQGHH